MSLAHIKTLTRLTTDTLVTVTRETGPAIKGKVGKIHSRPNSIRASVKDSNSYETLGALTYWAKHDTQIFFEPPHPGEDTRIPVVEFKTHGVEVDWDEPVRSSLGLSYVVDCDECGGLMKRDGQHWPRSKESYACQDCENTGHWSRSQDKVRKPTRYEWAVHALTNPSPFVTIADRYIPDGYSRPGYYFREACPSDPTHYTRTITSETGSASFNQFNDLKLSVCPECGVTMYPRTRTYSNGYEEWGEPETHGSLSEEFQTVIEQIEDGEVELFIPHQETSRGLWKIDDDIPVRSSPSYEDGVIICLKDGELFMNVVGQGGIHINPDGTSLGKIAWWFKNVEDTQLRAPAHLA